MKNLRYIIILLIATILVGCSPTSNLQSYQIPVANNIYFSPDPESPVLVFFGIPVRLLFDKDIYGAWLYTNPDTPSLYIRENQIIVLLDENTQYSGTFTHLTNNSLLVDWSDGATTVLVYEFLDNRKEILLITELSDFTATPLVFVRYKIKTENL